MKRRRADTKTFAERLWSRIDTSGDCWLWTGTTNANGYGIIRVGGRHGWNELVHRVIYRLRIGPIPAGRGVLHRCDVPNCCRPEHLYAGDQQANADDMVGRGRVARRERHSQAKLTQRDADEIRRSPEPNRALARTYGVDETTIRHVRAGRTWQPIDRAAAREETSR